MSVNTGPAALLQSTTRSWDLLLSEWLHACRAAYSSLSFSPRAGVAAGVAKCEEYDFLQTRP